MKNWSIHKRATLSGHQAAIYALSPAPEAHCFFSGDGNGWVVKWNLQSTETAELLAKVPSNIFALCLIKTQNLLAVGSMQGILYVIDIEQKKVVPPTLQFTKAIYKILVYNNTLLLGTGDGMLHFLSIPEFTLQKSLTVSDKSIRDIAIHPTQPIAAIACSDHQIHLVNISNAEKIQTLEGHQNSVFSVQFSKEGKHLFSGSRDAHLQVWKQTTKTNLYHINHRIPAHLFTINSLALHPDGQLLASASRDKSIKIWSAQHFNLIKVIDQLKTDLKAHLNSVNKLLWLPYENTLISASDDRSIGIWEVELVN